MSSPNAHLVSGRVESPQAFCAGTAEGVFLTGWKDGSWAITDAVLALPNRNVRGLCVELDLQAGEDQACDRPT